jgi:hypothetical protein
MLEKYTLDPIFQTWIKVQPICHNKVKSAHPRLRSYFIDALPPETIDDLKQNKCVAITNSILDTDFFDNTDYILRVPDSFYGVYYYPYEIVQKDQSKDFNCLINRMDPFRQSWLYQLVRRNLFDLGYISFNMDISRMPCNAELTQQQAFEAQFQRYCSIFAEEHNKVKHLVPFKNFDDDGDITEVLMDSKFSLVLETYFDNNHIVTYSEKIFRCLQLPRPWLLFSHQHAVSHLRGMGFDVLDDIVPHDHYDIIEHAANRQSKLLDMMEQLVSTRFDNHQRLMAAATHNQDLLKKFSLSWEKDLDNTIQLALQKINDRG